MAPKVKKTPKNLFKKTSLSKTKNKPIKKKKPKAKKKKTTTTAASTTKKKPTAAQKKNAARASRAKLEKILPMLQSLKKASPKYRPILLSHMDGPSCNAMYETIHNVLTNPRVPVGQRKKLRKMLFPYKNELRYLATQLNSETKKRKLIQMGGTIPFGSILSTAIPLLLNVLRSSK